MYNDIRVADIAVLWNVGSPQSTYIIHAPLSLQPVSYPFYYLVFQVLNLQFLIRNSHDSTINILARSDLLTGNYSGHDLRDISATSG